MKKRLMSAAALFLAAAALWAKDVTVLLDVSESVLPIYASFEDQLLKRILPETLGPDDTVHLITFANEPSLETRVDLTRPRAIRSLVDTLFLLNPLGHYTDLVAAFRFLADYVENLPDPGAVIILTDGIHDPPPGSPYAGMSSDQVRDALRQQSERIRAVSDDLRLLTYGAGADAARAARDNDGQASGTGEETSADGQTDQAQPSSTGTTQEDTAGNSASESGSRESPEQPPVAEEGAGSDSRTADEQTTSAPADSGSTQADTTHTDSTQATTPSPADSGSSQAGAGQANDGSSESGESADTGESLSTSGRETATTDESGDSQIKTIEDSLVTEAEIIEPSPQQSTGSFPWLWVLGGFLVLGAGFGLYVLLKEHIGHALPGYHTHGSRPAEDKSPHIQMNVIGQNKNIGLRNIHWIGTRSGKTVGGSGSQYLIFVIHVPPNIGKIVCSGEGRFTFVPRKQKYFPDLSGPLQHCLDERIRIRGDKGQEIEVVFTEWISPLEQLNRIMHLVDRPGLPTDWKGADRLPGGVFKEPER